MEITDGYGADVVFYCGGGLEVWELAERILAPFGRLVIEANPPKVDHKYPVTASKLVEKSMTYIGVAGYDVAQFEVGLHFIEARKINTGLIITHKFSLNDYNKAFETAESRKDDAIKVLFNSF